MRIHSDDGGLGLFRTALCCSCRQPVACCKAVNLVELLRVATWPHPRSADGRALAVLCDACYERSPRPAVHWAVEFDGEGLRYHTIEDLEAAPLIVGRIWEGGAA